MKQETILLFEQLYAGQPIPYFCFDAQGTIQWYNAAASQKIPGLAKDLNMRSVFYDHNFDSMMSILKSGQLYETPLIDHEASAQFMYCTPFMEGGELQYVFVLLRDFAEYAPISQSVDQSKMLTAISGQYRSPIFCIFNSLSAIEKSLEEHDLYEQLDYVRNISRSCYKMMRTTVNFTEYMKISDNYADFEFKRVDFSLFMKNICQSIEIMLRNTDIQFHYSIETGDMVTIIDPERMTMAIMNLMSNACMYSNPDCEIEITVTKQGEDIAVNVRDNGVGLPSSDLQKIFEPFYSHDPNGSLYPGTGLGLTIFKAVVEGHNGRYLINSAEGQGTSVLFRFPIKNDSDGLTVCESPPNYIINRFSPLYIYLADICDCTGF